MKKTLLLSLAFFCSIFMYAQTSGINYKALIKNGNGDIAANQEVTIQFQISENGTPNIYVETHTPTTDANGIAIVTIGTGTSPDNFLDIDWSFNDHTLNVQVDTGDGLVDLGTIPFMSVPYAFFAENTRKGTLNDAYNKGGDGEGRTINATDGKVEITGDGLEVKTGTSNTILFVDGTKNAVGLKTNAPRGALDVNSANNGGFVLPVATTNPETDILNIQDPTASVPYGTLVYDAVNNCLSMYRGGSNEGWICVSEPAPPLEVDCNLNGLSDDFVEGVFLGSYTYSVTITNLSALYPSQAIAFNYTDVVLSGPGLGTISPNATAMRILGGSFLADGESIVLSPNESITISYRLQGDTGTAGSTINATWNNLSTTCTDSTIVLDPVLKLRSYSDYYEVVEGDDPAGTPYIVNALIDGGTPSVDVQLSISHNGDPSDITPASQLVTILAGTNTIPAIFTIVGDSVIEGDEEFIFTLEIVTGPPNLSFAVNGETHPTLTIIDDDLPSLNIGYFDDDFKNIFESSDLIGYKTFIENNFGFGKTIDTKGNGEQFGRINFIDIDNMAEFSLEALNLLDLDIIWVNEFESFWLPQNAEQVLLDWANTTNDGGVIIASLHSNNDGELHEAFGHEFLGTPAGNSIISVNNSYLTSGAFGSVPVNTAVNYNGTKRSIALGSTNNPELWALESSLPLDDGFAIVAENRGVFLSSYLFFEEMSNDGIVNTNEERFLAKIFAFAVSRIGQ